MKERSSWWYKRCSRCSTHQNHREEQRGREQSCSARLLQRRLGWARRVGMRLESERCGEEGWRQMSRMAGCAQREGPRVEGSGPWIGPMAVNACLTWPRPTLWIGSSLLPNSSMIRLSNSGSKTATDSLNEPSEARLQRSFRCTFFSSLACCKPRSDVTTGLKRNSSRSRQYSS